jgi:hypothetical protein
MVIEDIISHNKTVLKDGQGNQTGVYYWNTDHAYDVFVTKEVCKKAGIRLENFGKFPNKLNLQDSIYIDEFDYFNLWKAGILVVPKEFNYKNNVALSTINWLEHLLIQRHIPYCVWAISQPLNSVKQQLKMKDERPMSLAEKAEQGFILTGNRLDLMIQFLSKPHHLQLEMRIDGISHYLELGQYLNKKHLGSGFYNFRYYLSILTNNAAALTRGQSNTVFEVCLEGTELMGMIYDNNKNTPEIQQLIRKGY